MTNYQSDAYRELNRPILNGVAVFVVVVVAVGWLIGRFWVDFVAFLIRAFTYLSISPLSCPVLLHCYPLIRSQSFHPTLPSDSFLGQ